MCRRGLIMGIWNSHTSFGNIIGAVIASAFVDTSWGLSFIVPGAIIAFLGIVCFFTLVESKFALCYICHECVCFAKFWLEHQLNETFPKVVSS